MIFAIIPVKKFENSKTRLSPLLNEEERVWLSRLMLEDTLFVLATIKSIQLVVVSSDKRAKEIASKHGAKFLQEDVDRGVNSAVALADQYCQEQKADATIVIPQDLPLLESKDIEMVLELAHDESKCIVICPSQRYDGTNLLLRKPSAAIKTHYDNDSYENHIQSANNLGIPVKLFFSKKIISDIDTPEDVDQIAKETSVNQTIEFLKSKIPKN